MAPDWDDKYQDFSVTETDKDGNISFKKVDVMGRQVGGEHYKKHSIQPWSIIDDYALNYYEGNILKYLLRDKSNRVEDLEKLIHYAEKEISNLTEDVSTLRESFVKNGGTTPLNE